MWPFKKSLSERYSKLVKLIKSIDSHFQMTENKEDSLRLHLPNYKGNQPMDFNIYLMEPFLFISFVTEIEGEKISCLNNFPQDTDQQDMFNLAMSNNLNKIHQVLEEKYKDGQAEENNKGTSFDSAEDIQDKHENRDFIEAAIEDLKENFNYNESFKKHALTFMILRPNTEFWCYANINDEKPLWIYNDKQNDKDKGVYMMENSYAAGVYPFVWFINKYDSKEDLCWILDFLNRQNIDLWANASVKTPQELINEMKLYVPSLRIGNDPQRIKSAIEWAWIDMLSFIRFIDYCMNSLDWTRKPDDRLTKPQDCRTIQDMAYLMVKDMGFEYNHSSKTVDDSEPSIVASWSLLDFAKMHGKMKRIPSSSHINSETGEEELSAAYCIFVHPTNKDEQGNPVITAIVSFSLELGELTAKEIGEQKDDLIVVKYESGNYSLKRKEIVEKKNPSTETTKVGEVRQMGMDKINNIETTFCKYCGKRIDANSKFCIYCGKQLNLDVYVLRDFPNAIISALPINSMEDLDGIISIGNESLKSGDYKKAYFYLREAARFGDAQSAFNTGLLLFNGNGVEKDEERAISFFMQAAEKGFTQAYNSLGVCFALGKGVPKDMSKAVSWYQKGADKGDMLAQNSLGRCYLIGDGVEKNLELGIYWTKKSAEQGYNGSLFNMGYCYETGLGVPKDVSKAIHYYKEALEKGYHQAEQRLKIIQKN